MQMGHRKTIDGPYPASHTSSTEVPFRGVLASKSLLHCPLLKPSTLQPRMLQKKAFGCVGSSASCSATSTPQPHSTATTKQHSCLPQMTISMHAPNISTSVIISFGRQ